jgi:uncharacterized protein
MTWELLTEALPFLAIGFVAQLFDGALGMGFGVISYTVLIALGFPKIEASAAINGAKIFTGAVSGGAHMYYRNIDWVLFKRLALAGVVGGGIGAYLLIALPHDWVGPVVNGYLILIGLVIVWRAGHPAPANATPARAMAVGGVGGTLEALSGVWGPLVTSHLVAMGLRPRFVVGSVSLAEFVVAVAVFIMLVGQVSLDEIGPTVIGLVAGALLAAPIAAKLARDLPPRWMMIGVGVLVIGTSLYRLGRDLL